MSNQQKERQSSEQHYLNLPQGVKLLHTLEGHESSVTSLAFDKAGGMMASGSRDGTIRLWTPFNGEFLNILEWYKDSVFSVAFNPDGRMLATGNRDGKVTLWWVPTGALYRNLVGHTDSVRCVAFDPSGRVLATSSEDGTIKLWGSYTGNLIRTLSNQRTFYKQSWSIAFDTTGQILASGNDDGTINLWDTSTGNLIRSLNGHSRYVRGIAFDNSSRILASGSYDSTIKLWDSSSGELLHTLEGHTSRVDAVAFSGDSRVLASKSIDQTVRLWNCETWETIAVILELTNPDLWVAGLAFHPKLPLLATAGSNPGTPSEERAKLIHIWRLDFDVLLRREKFAKPALTAVHHTTAKIVLVGDSGVGKTGLGWRLAHKEFKEHSSTHGQQFWVIDELGKRREDGTECEAILWDLAGQPDYRLTHALFLDDADLALVLFDPTDNRDPLHGVEFWLKHLKAGQASMQENIGGEKGKFCPTILVGGRVDRGEARLTQEELDEFCHRRGISGGYLATSAKEEIGLEELLRRMKEQIPWEEKSAIVTTVTFKRIKDYVLGMKETQQLRTVIVSPQDLREQLEKMNKNWEFTDAEMMTAVKHLANYGYVHVLRTSQGEERVLLVPELLNNLAASFVLEARRNPKGLGLLEEKRLLAGEYGFRELEKLSEEEQSILLDAAALLFLQHNVCFRETDLGGTSYLVFPELINLKKPLLEDEQTEDGVAYTVSGAIENVYASLVVLLGYTQTFTRTNQWRSHARYEVGDGLICGFKQDAEREGELDLVLYFGTNVGQPVRTLFQGLFESFLARRNLSVFRFEPVVCSNGHHFNRVVVRDQMRMKKEFAFCPACGDRQRLPKADEPIQLTQTERRKVEEQQWFAARRSGFEQAVFQLVSYVEDRKLKRPECFISYAWGEKAQERWVEHSLATDLQKAGINVVLDRWENERVGASVPRYVERIEKSDWVIVVGTPLYRKKYENRETATGYVVAAEVDLLSNRLLGTEEQKKTVLPILLAGERVLSFPALLHSRVFADFRAERSYFEIAFDLILDIYGIAHNDTAVADLRESLRDWERH